MNQVFSSPQALIKHLVAEEKTNNKEVRLTFGKHNGKLITEVPNNYLQWLKQSGYCDSNDNAISDWLKINIK